jgi:trimeric autotransporter adhesin
VHNNDTCSALVLSALYAGCADKANAVLAERAARAATIAKELQHAAATGTYVQFASAAAAAACLVELGQVTACCTTQFDTRRTAADRALQAACTALPLMQVQGVADAALCLGAPPSQLAAALAAVRQRDEQARARLAAAVSGAAAAARSISVTAGDRGSSNVGGQSETSNSSSSSSISVDALAVGNPTAPQTPRGNSEGGVPGSTTSTASSSSSSSSTARLNFSAASTFTCAVPKPCTACCSSASIGATSCGCVATELAAAASLCERLGFGEDARCGRAALALHRRTAAAGLKALLLGMPHVDVVRNALACASALGALEMPAQTLATALKSRQEQAVSELHAMLEAARAEIAAIGAGGAVIAGVPFRAAIQAHAAAAALGVDSKLLSAASQALISMQQSAYETLLHLAEHSSIAELRFAVASTTALELPAQYARIAYERMQVRRTAAAQSLAAAATACCLHWGAGGCSAPSASVAEQLAALQACCSGTADDHCRGSGMSDLGASVQAEGCTSLTAQLVRELSTSVRTCQMLGLADNARAALQAVELSHATGKWRAPLWQIADGTGSQSQSALTEEAWGTGFGGPETWPSSISLQGGIETIYAGSHGPLSNTLAVQVLQCNALVSAMSNGNQAGAPPLCGTCCAARVTGGSSSSGARAARAATPPLVSVCTGGFARGGIKAPPPLARSSAGMASPSQMRHLRAVLEANIASSPAGCLATLPTLDLSLERLHSLAGLGQLCPALTVLRVGLNRLTNLDGLAGCSQLRELCLWVGAVGWKGRSATL